MKIVIEKCVLLGMLLPSLYIFQKLHLERKVVPCSQHLCLLSHSQCMFTLTYLQSPSGLHLMPHKSYFHLCVLQSGSGRQQWMRVFAYLLCSETWSSVLLDFILKI